MCRLSSMTSMSDQSAEYSTLSETQRRELCALVGRALVQIRGLALRGHSEQAGELADAFHALPTMLYAPLFSWESLEVFLTSYHGRYPPAAPGDFFDYLSAIRDIRNSRMF